MSSGANKRRPHSFQGFEHRPHPKDGDPILHCGHVKGKLHFFRSTKMMVFRRPDGTEWHSRWILCCPSCYTHAGGDPTKTIMGDGIWKGENRVEMSGETGKPPEVGNG